MSIYHEARPLVDREGREVNPVTVEQRWPVTVSIHSSKYQAEMALAFQAHGVFVYRVCQSERGWEVVACPDYLEEQIFRD